MPPTLEQLKARVRERGRKFDLFYWADIFMNEYGMSFEEFKKLNIPAFYFIRNTLIKRKEREAKSFKRKR